MHAMLAFCSSDHPINRLLHPSHLVQRPVHKNRLAVNVLALHGAPHATVIRGTTMVPEHKEMIRLNTHWGVTLIVEVAGRNIGLAQGNAVYPNMAIANAHLVPGQSDYSLDVRLGRIEGIAENHHVTALDRP